MDNMEFSPAIAAVLRAVIAAYAHIINQNPHIDDESESEEVDFSSERDIAIQILHAIIDDPDNLEAVENIIHEAEEGIDWDVVQDILNYVSDHMSDSEGHDVADEPVDEQGVEDQVVEEGGILLDDTEDLDEGGILLESNKNLSEPTTIYPADEVEALSESDFVGGIEIGEHSEIDPSEAVSSLSEDDVVSNLAPEDEPAPDE
jgi:hypothetical protein